MNRLLASRGFISVAGAVLAAVVAVAAYFVVFDPMKKTVAYCAMMPDAVGLYPGNHVTMLGISVGTVNRIRPDGTGVRVDFTVDARHALHGDVSATTVNDTVVADRQLAVLGDSHSPTRWPSGQCITKTFTPKSITETLAAFTKVANELGGSEAGQTQIGGAIAALAKATSGTGPRINALINELGTALRAPDAAIGHVGALVDAINGLATAIANHWDEIESMLQPLDIGLSLINVVWDEVVQLLNSILVILPWFNSITVKYGSGILHGLDASVRWLDLLAANAGSLEKLLALVPGVTAAFRRVTDPKTGKLQISYAAPRQGNVDLVSVIAGMAAGR